MKQTTKRGGNTTKATTRLVNEQRRLLQEIDRYMAENEELSGASLQGLQKLESILQQDLATVSELKA